MPWNDPLVTPGMIKPAQDALEQPRLNQSQAMARLKGFGSGALEGLRGLTTPLSLAGMALPALKGVGMLPEAASAGMEGGSALEQALSKMGGAGKMAGSAGEFTEGMGFPHQVPANETAQALEALRQGMGSQAGEVNPHLLIGGATAGGLGYAGYNLLKKLGAKTDEMQKKYNPLQRATDILDQSGGH